MIFIILFAAIILASCGQILTKITAVRHLRFDDSTSLLSNIMSLLRAPIFYLAMSIYLLSMTLYLIALSKLDISFAYPILSLTFAFILVYSKIFFKENVTPLRWFGVGIIIFGVFLISRS
jgi:multidrug transporter EmrE-like cation transporter